MQNDRYEERIDGLATLVHAVYELDPYEDAIFLFCGRFKDCYKCMYFNGDRFVLALLKYGCEETAMAQERK